MTKVIKKRGRKPGTKLTKTRADAQINRQIIRDAIIELLRSSKTKRRPTLEELSKHTGFSKLTIHKHLKDLKVGDLKDELKPLTDDVLLGIYRAAVQGSSSSQKLWLQFVEDWNEKNESKVEVNIKNEPPSYIQIE